MLYVAALLPPMRHAELMRRQRYAAADAMALRAARCIRHSYAARHDAVYAMRRRRVPGACRRAAAARRLYGAVARLAHASARCCRYTFVVYAFATALQARYAIS